MRTRAIILAALTLGASCGITTPELDEIGTVKFIGVEGGCWAIETDDEIYEPIDLPEHLRTDGLSVSFQANERGDLASICMVGTIIELLRIQPNGG